MNIGECIYWGVYYGDTSNINHTPYGISLSDFLLMCLFEALCTLQVPGLPKGPSVQAQTLGRIQKVDPYNGGFQ